MGIDYEPDEFPVVFWDLFGEQGHPIRTTVFEMGPLLLSRMLDLNDTQEGVINIAFRFADDEFGATDTVNKGLVDLKDLRELLIICLKTARRSARVRQRRACDGRCGAASVAGAGEPGWHQVLRRAGDHDQRFHATERTAAASSTCSPPTS